MIGEFKIEVMAQNGEGLLEVNPGVSDIFNAILNGSLKTCEEKFPAEFQETTINQEFWQNALWHLKFALERCGHETEMWRDHPDMPPALILVLPDSEFMALQLRQVFPDSIEELTQHG